VTHASHSAQTEAETPHRTPHTDPITEPLAPDAALAALVTAARLHHVTADAVDLRHRLGLGLSERAGVDHVVAAARLLGLTARRSRSTARRLARAPLPALALMHDGSLAVLMHCDGDRVVLHHCADAARRPHVEPVAAFEQRWSGELVLLASRASLAAGLSKFDFTWFVPSLVRHRRLLGEVLVVSVFLQVFALVTPLFFQVVMDKVLVHRGLATLDVLVCGLVAVALFETVLGALRAYVLSHTTSRIDVELGSRLYRHLMALPLPWFEARRVGDSVARVRELEHIRAFLTGGALTLVLDVLFSAVFIGVMFAYSVPLTLVVLASLPLYALLTVAVVPALRARLNEKFARGAESQALLVESVTGVQALKAGALEPMFCRRWDDRLAAYVSASFRAQALATFAHEGIALVGKLVGAATLWLGARLVMDSATHGAVFTVGMFIAFNMFAGRVAQPIMRLAQMWADFQQTGISMQRLADILDAPTERPRAAAAPLPPLQGRIEFDRVTFRYQPDAAPALRELNFEIRSGEVVGIVGRSGSGKSTLAKLVQRLYVPELGCVRIDGTDIAQADVAQLRRQVGVVLQDNVLFNRSVRDNIAIADPAAPLDAVMRVARLAGAHDFIAGLAQGYDTVVGEQGCGLSGGQRQRIAIARALFGNPRILILDEATSALDYESEAVLQQNMAEICRGRTVIIIAHRLSAVRHAHRILAMDAGRPVEAGTHDALLRHDGLYAHLWRLQTAPPAALPPATRERCP
jgi:subfamily B ATP-binding cassette protein HlyB/CyaB